MKHKCLIAIGVVLIQALPAFAVTSVVARHQSSADFLKGQPQNILIDSSGTLRLSRQSEPVDLGGLLDDVWSIHTMYADAAGTVYLGTGPNAKVIRLADGKAEQVYPLVADASTDTGTTILNQHVFALAQDVAGRLLIGISGDKGQLVRLSNGQPEVIFEDSRVQYIFAIALDGDNNIYLGTGPNGLLIKLNPFGQNPEVVFDSKDRSILSLAVQDNVIYAGGDQRGLVYRIDPQSKRAAVLYDSDQDEIPSLLVDKDGYVYAAATTAGAAMLQLQMPAPALRKAPGRPDTDESGAGALAESVKAADSGEEEEKKEEPAPARQAPPPPAARAAGHIYRISPDGFVTDVFSEMAVLYSLTQSDGKLWLATGNKGQLFTVDPVAEEAAVLYENKTSTQISSVVHVGDSAYLGLSNPAQLVRISPELYSSGTFDSAFLDAGQPALWGKLQVKADIPDGAKVAMSCRSGNVDDPNDQTFSPWTDEVTLSDTADLHCPQGRFCQYRLALTASPDGQTPVVREVAAAYVVPNLAPRVAAVKAERSRDKKKLYAFDVSFVAADDNKDDLDYTLEFRKAGNTVWIPLKDQLDQPRYEWDTRTVEDGRYEVRVTANDYKSNTPDTALTGSRISDVFVIDNSAPQIKQADIMVNARGTGGCDVILKLAAEDAWSILGKVQYTVDSNEKWLTALPDDLVYDTLSETFTIRNEKVKSGRHVVAVMIADEAENAMYKSWEVDVP